MKEREELISDLNDELFTYDKDFTNEDVYALFEKYVNNKAALRKVITFGMFHYEYVKYKMLFEGCLYEDGLSLIITQFRQAYQRNSKEFQRVTEKYVDDISRGYESQVQIAWLTDHKDKHERLDLFVKQAFIVIGDLIENAFKPFAFLLNELMNIGEGKDSKQTSLGGIVESLCEKNEILKALCKDLLMDISISQWRNISDHGSYECKGEDICLMTKHSWKSRGVEQYQCKNHRVNGKLVCLNEFVSVSNLEHGFVKAYNTLLAEGDVKKWEVMSREGTPLQKVRGKQMLELAEAGPITTFVPELAQLVIVKVTVFGARSYEFEFMDGGKVRI